MSEFFDKLLDWLPLLIVAVIWCAVLPVRVAVLLLLPAGARAPWHKLHAIHDFFAFEVRLYGQPTRHPRQLGRTRQGA